MSVCNFKTKYMILVINGTNRPGNRTKIISKFCFDYLSKNANRQIKFFNLEDINDIELDFNIYDKANVNSSLQKIQDDFFIPASHWLLIAPEYNGSFPGVLKMFLDALSARKYNEVFDNKNIGLIGTSDGRAGNLRGMDHLTSFLNYLKFTVYPNKLPISSLSSVIQNEDINQSTRETLEKYLNDYLRWIEH